MTRLETRLGTRGETIAWRRDCEAGDETVAGDMIDHWNLETRLESGKITVTGNEIGD